LLKLVPRSADIARKRRGVLAGDAVDARAIASSYTTEL